MDYKQRRDEQRRESGLSNYSDDDEGLDMIGLDTATTGMHEVVLKPAKKVMAETG